MTSESLPFASFSALAEDQLRALLSMVLAFCGYMRLGSRGFQANPTAFRPDREDNCGRLPAIVT